MLPSPEYTFKTLLETYGKGRQTYCVRFDPKEVFTKNFMFKEGHRQMIEHKFKEEFGVQVIQHNHEYDHTYERPVIKKCGLIYSHSDSELFPMIEIWGIEGVSVVQSGQA